MFQRIILKMFSMFIKFGNSSAKLNAMLSSARCHLLTYRHVEIFKQASKSNTSK